MKIHLGCGTQYMDGWFNIDIDDSLKADLHADFSDGLPKLDDGCADEIVTVDMLEHVYDKISSFNELGRLLEIGGILRIQVPSVISPAAFQDPTHVSFYCKESFHWQYWTNPPSFLGLKYSFNVISTVETIPDENGNVWVQAELMKTGKNPNYKEGVKTEWQKMKDKIS